MKFMQKLATRLANRLGMSVADLSALMIAFSLYLIPLPCSGEQAQPTTLTGQTLFESEVKCAALSPDSNVLVAGAANGLWRINLSTSERSFLNRHASESVAFAPDGKTVAIGDREGLVHLYDTASWKLLWSIPAHDEPVDRIATSPDGRWLVTASSRASSVNRWLMPSLQPASSITSEDAGMNIAGLTYSPDSQILVVVGESGQAHCFSTVRDALGMINFLRQPVVKQAKPTFQTIAFLNSEQFAVGGHGSPVNAWSLKSWRVERQLPAPQTKVLVIAPLGDAVVTGGEGADATILSHEGVITHALQETMGTKALLVDPKGRIIAAGKYGVKRFDR